MNGPRASTQIDLADLPASARELIGLIGLPATLRLVEALPGIKFKVPRGEANNDAGAARFALLEEAVGEAAARTLLAHYGGTDLYIPSCKAALRKARNRQLCADSDDGASIDDLVLRYRLSYRQIQSVLKATDTAPVAVAQQADLFA